MIQYYMVRVKTEEERCERILVPLRWIAKLKKIQFPISSFIVIVLIQGLFPPAPTHLASPKIDPAIPPAKVPSFLFLQLHLPA
jgi:Na+-transporting methylmalonyl-CoA/oxaloacetate decarboxylase beta subunit